MAHRPDDDLRAESVPSRPVRTCVGCRQRATKAALVRVVVGEGDRGAAAVPDPAGTAPGRGAHLHPDPACFDLAVRRKAFSRALRHPGGLDLVPLATYLDVGRTEADTVRQTDKGSSSS